MSEVLRWTPVAGCPAARPGQPRCSTTYSCGAG